jgi:hypothetical protein
MWDSSTYVPQEQTSGGTYTPPITYYTYNYPTYDFVASDGRLWRVNKYTGEAWRVLLEGAVSTWIKIEEKGD